MAKTPLLGTLGLALLVASAGAGRAEGLVAPKLDTSVVQTFLDQLSATIPAVASRMLCVSA